MLKFARNKLVTVYLRDKDTLAAHGVLEDDIYGLEMDAHVRISDRQLISVTGKWNRYTTPECPRALDFIQKAEGLVIEAGLEKTLQKIIGRAGCRHYATLLTEMCKSIESALNLMGLDRMGSEKTAVVEEQAPADAKPSRDRVPETSRIRYQKAPGEFIMDLHVHTHPASSCATGNVEAVIQQAMRLGLDGICLTEHNYTWPQEAVEELRQKFGYLILIGNEITTDQGHMVVFNLDRDLSGNGIIKLADLRHMVDACGGFIICAHPFRGFLTFGVGKLGLTVEKASERPLFAMVDAVEVLNGKVTEEENQFAAKVAANLNLPATGGSDAHTAAEVGCFATVFNTPIRDEAHLVEILKTGIYRPVVFNPT